MGDMKQGQLRVSTNVRCHSTKYSHPGSLVPRTCVWLCVFISHQQNTNGSGTVVQKEN